MKLISSKKTKRRIALMFVFAFMLSNLLSLFGPSAQAVVTITAPSAGTCFQHTGTVANGALVTVYNIGAIQITLTAAEISPAEDVTAQAGTTTGVGVAQATDPTFATGGDIDDAGDVIGNVFSFIPPTGTNFVIVPGFQATTRGISNQLAAANATIANAVSQDGTSGGVDGSLGISVGVITSGTVGVGRAIVAITKDAATTGNGATETYPKTNTGTNTATITVNGLGLAIPPSGDQAFSGTLQATLDANPPSGIGTGGGSGTPAVAAAIPGLTGTINLCTATSAAGQIEAVLDTDNDSTELYDKSGTASQNLLALGQVSSNTTVAIFDTGTLAAGVGSSSLCDTEPILIKGTGTTLTGPGSRDQVFATGRLVSDIDSDAEAPGTTALDISSASLFGNSNVAPITIAYADDNAQAVTTLQAVDIIISQSTAGATPVVAGGNGAQSSRSGFLGALRAALHEGGVTASYTDNLFGSTWGVAAIGGGGGSFAVQESANAGALGSGVGARAALTGNTTEPFHNTFVDLRIRCDGTAPVAGWYAVINSGVAANTFGTVAGGTLQLIKTSQAGVKYAGSSTFYAQTLTNISGTTPTVQHIHGDRTVAAGLDTVNGSNALLYASCTNNTLTIFPIQDAFDNARDILAITPRLQVTNVSNTFTSDVNIIAQISGNNLTGTTTLNLAKLVGVPPTGQGSNLASAQGVAVAENSQLAVDCSSGGQSNVVLGSITSGTVPTAVAAACTSGVIATPPAFFTGGAPNSVSGTTVIDGSPTVQGESRGILFTEATATGFNELTNQVGGGPNGTVFEVQFPTGCDVIDDRDDNNTAVSSTAATGGNDVARFTVTQTGGLTAAVTAGGSGDAAITNANVIATASGTTPAKAYFRIVNGTTGTAADAAVTDAILFRIDSQDLFCPGTVTGDLSAMVLAQNKVSAPTLTATLGTVMLGTAKQALSFGFADDVVNSTKGETSTNSNIGVTPRLVGGAVSTSHTFKITELDARAIPIGGRVASRNLDPDNSLLSSLLTRGQIWVIPSSGAAFSAAPVAADVTFSDTSLVADGTPTLVTSAAVDSNAPLGSIIIGVKRNTASGAADPALSTTTVTVKNLKLAAATSSTTDLVASVEFFSQDSGVVVNTPGVSAGNSSSTPTVFSPFAPGSTKASTQLNVATTSAVQLGAGSLANQLLTARLTTAGTPQLNPFAKPVTTQGNADGTKISVSATAPPAAASSSSGGSTALATENIVTVTGSAGAVDAGAQVVITTATGSSTTTYDSATIVASNDGSFTAKLRGDCTNASNNLTVTVTEQVSGTNSNAVTKTVICGGTSGETADSVFNEIAGSDGKVTVQEVLSYVSSHGGLSAIVTAGGAKLAGVIKAAKSALGLS